MISDDTLHDRYMHDTNSAVKFILDFSLNLTFHLNFQHLISEFKNYLSLRHALIKKKNNK